jgi:hypothetical protein
MEQSAAAASGRPWRHRPKKPKVQQKGSRAAKLLLTACNQEYLLRNPANFGLLGSGYQIDN